jgi:hypothetical protein
LNDLFDKAAVLKSVLNMVPPRFKELNEKAFKIGMSYAKKAKQEEA